MNAEQSTFDQLKTLIMTRRAVRQFNEKPVSDSDILDMVQAGIWAPSGSNMNARFFVVVKDKEQMTKIRALSPGMFSVPTAMMFLCTDMKKALEVGGTQGLNKLSIMDVALSAQNILLTAWEKGISTCPVGGFNAVAVSKILNLPDHVRPDLVITIGYATEQPEAPERPEVEEVTFFEQFGRKQA